jgi:hypothetical protein
MLVAAEGSSAVSPAAPTTASSASPQTATAMNAAAGPKQMTNSLCKA